MLNLNALLTKQFFHRGKNKLKTKTRGVGFCIIVNIYNNTRKYSTKNIWHCTISQSEFPKALEDHIYFLKTNLNEKGNRYLEDNFTTISTKNRSKS